MSSVIQPVPEHTPAPGEPGHRTGPVAGSSRVRRWAGLLALGLMLGACGVLLACLALTQEPPPWWNPVNPSDATVIERARRIENNAATLLTQVRSNVRTDSAQPAIDASAPWTISVPVADANAWLAARLPAWVESQRDDAHPERGFHWPKELSLVQVDFDNERISIAASVLSGGKSQVLSATLHPEFRDDGSLWIPAGTISLGRLSVPARWMLRSKSSNSAGSMLMGEAVPRTIANMPQTGGFVNALAGERAALKSPIIKIGDGRRVRLVNIQPAGDKLYITLQTLPRETATAGKTP